MWGDNGKTATCSSSPLPRVPPPAPHARLSMPPPLVHPTLMFSPHFLDAYPLPPLRCVLGTVRPCSFAAWASRTRTAPSSAGPTPTGPRPTSTRVCRPSGILRWGMHSAYWGEEDRHKIATPLPFPQLRVWGSQPSLFATTSSHQRPAIPLSMYTHSRTCTRTTQRVPRGRPAPFSLRC